jgi:hypothetical protein
MIISPQALKDGAVVASKIAAGAVTDIKLSSDFLKVVSDTTLVAAATTINLTGLNLETDGCYIICLSTKDNIASNGHIHLNFNSDTTDTDYYSSASGGANNADINGYSSGETQQYFICIQKVVGCNPTAVALQFRGTTSGAPATVSPISIIKKDSTANVTSIQLVASGANALISGTRVILFKSVI